MELTVLGSSSEGNAYVLQNAGEALLLEAGIPFKKVLAALGNNVKKIVGCLITHEHGDHAGRINEVLNYVVPVYASKGTIEAAKINSIFRTMEVTSIYGWAVLLSFPFPRSMTAANRWASTSGMKKRAAYCSLPILSICLVHLPG